MILDPKRVLLKVSGESLQGSSDHGLDQNAAIDLAKVLKNIQNDGLEIGVVLGGGNLFRGVHFTKHGFSATPADHMGMLATIMNGIALEQSLLSLGVDVCLMSAIECRQVAEPYLWKKALMHMQKKKIVIFVGGTGNPYFTTDTAAALRACEMGVDLLIKATKVDGVYADDPMKDPNAKRYETLSYAQALQDRLEVMDATAIALCMSHEIPLFVMNMKRLKEAPLKELLQDRSHGTLIVSGET